MSSLNLVILSDNSSSHQGYRLTILFQQFNEKGFQGGTQNKLGLPFMNFSAVKIWPYKKSKIKQVF